MSLLDIRHHLDVTPPKKRDTRRVLEDIATSEEVISAHRAWESQDETWRMSKKSRDDIDIINAYGAAVRAAMSAKDYYHDEAARMACRVARESGVITPYELDTVGSAYKKGEAEELSVEWHNLRRTGIGGSSLSEALGFHWMSQPGNPVWMSDQERHDYWAALAIEKMTPVTEVSNPTSGVLLRGHLWEEALLVRYSLLTGDTIAVSKATWGGGLDIQSVNLDGIIMRDGSPVGIAECKTSSREWTWERGVPLHYRAQVLWYLHATGLEYAKVLVKFDSGHFDIHTIYADETIDGTNSTSSIDTYIPELLDRWDNLQKIITTPYCDVVGGEVFDVSPVLADEFHNQLDEAVDIGGDIAELREDIMNFPTVSVSCVSPYVRMPDESSVPCSAESFNPLDKTYSTYSFGGFSPIIYGVVPGEDSADAYIESIVGDVVFAANTETYRYLLSVTPPTVCVINVSAIRRRSEGVPGARDFDTCRQAVEWLARHIPELQDNNAG